MKVRIKESERIDIIKSIIENPLFLGDYKNEEGGILTFLEMTWDLRSMSSEDHRYNNARDDIWKHIVANDDITIEELFLDRLQSSYKDENKFVSLINSTVHPSVLKDEKKREDMVDFINRLLIKYNHRLVIGDYFGEIPIYIFSDNENVIEMPKDIIPNHIPFYNLLFPNKQYPCFVLEFNNGWNDWFKWKTSFHLSYCESNTSKISIGWLKLMKRDEDNTELSLAEAFNQLDISYCSVGADEEYYLNMKQYIPKSYHSVFLALRDAAMFPSIKDEFEESDCFKNSLLRDKESKQLLNSARYILNGIEVSSYYKFSYSFLPPYSEKVNDSIVNIDFDFKYGSDFDQRIYVLIGKNGTGKTTLLSQMANDFALANSNRIIPQKPLYNKLLTISFSFFDKLPLPVPNAQFNYTYLGLKGKNNEGNGDINIVLRKELRGYLNTINKKDRFRIWNIAVKMLFHNDIQDAVIDDRSYLKPIDVDRVMNVHALFSSGENLLLYIASSIISEIHDNTLILFDEPETHLHPNAISILMNVLYKLLDDFNSFCIIATHSPLVIQEVSSRNVKVLKRNGNVLDISSIGYETFAENLTTITDEVFGNREVAQYHSSIMKNIVNTKPRNVSYQEILSIFQNEQIPTSLNVKLYIKDLLNEKFKSI